MDAGALLTFDFWDVFFLVLIALLMWRMFFRKDPDVRDLTPKIPEPTPKMDLTLEELKKYNGIDDEHIFFCVFGTIFDVSRGYGFYGPGGPYHPLAGHDATIALGTMDVKKVGSSFLDYEIMTADERGQAEEWANNFYQKYRVVGALVQREEDKKDYEGEVAKIEPEKAKF